MKIITEKTKTRSNDSTSLINNSAKSLKAAINLYAVSLFIDEYPELISKAKKLKKDNPTIKEEELTSFIKKMIDKEGITEELFDVVKDFLEYGEYDDCLSRENMERCYKYALDYEKKHPFEGDDDYVFPDREPEPECPYAQFKVGDYVTIRSDLKVDTYWGDGGPDERAIHWFNSTKSQFRGEKLVITSVSWSGYSSEEPRILLYGAQMRTGNISTSAVFTQEMFEEYKGERHEYKYAGHDKYVKVE